MPICTGGSEIRENVPEALMVTWEYMASVLPFELNALKPFLPYVKPFVIPSVSAFCSEEPPGNPNMVSLTLAAMLSGNELGAGLVAAEAIEQVVLNYFWYAACKCSAMATPAPPAAPDLPTIPAINPPVLVQPPAAGPCATFGPAGAHLAANGNSVVLVPLGAVGTAGGATYAQGVVGIPPGALTAEHTWGTGASMGANHTATFLAAYYNAANGFISSTQFTAKQSGNSATSTAAVPAGATQVQIWVLNDSGAAAPAAIDVSYTLKFNCTASPNQPSVPCCPPDPILEGVLQQILRMVTLVQRQVAPFSYVYGANHAGLADTGEFTVADLLGVSVDVTGTGPGVGLEIGTPDRLFDVGFVSLGTADGWTQQRRIAHDGTLFLPTAAGVFTRVGWTLENGCTVAIRELVREP